MSLNVRLVKNAGVMMGMELGVRALDALVVILLARYLEPAGFGLLAFAISFAALFDILPGFGMGSLSVRNVARDPDQLNRVLSNGLIVKSLLAALTLVLIFATSRIFSHSADRCLVVMLAALLLVIETNVQYLLSFFQATDRMRTVALVNVAVRVGWLLSSLLVVWRGGGVAHLLGARVAVTAVGFLAALGLVHFRLHRIRWVWEPAFGWQLLKASVPFALFRVWLELYGDIDMVMLSTMRGDVVTSMYAASQKAMRIFNFIPAGVGAASLPALTRSHKRSLSEVTEITARSCKYLMVIGLALAGGICVVADQVVGLLYGPAYGGAAVVLRIAVWSLIFSFLNGTIISAIAAAGREQQGSNRLFVGVLFSALSNLVVIPPFGAAGAACTTVAARALIFCLQLRLLQKVLPNFRLLDVWKLTVSVALMMGVAWIVRPAGLAAVIAVAVPVYLGALIALRAVGRQEWDFLKKLLRGQGGVPVLPAEPPMPME